MKMGEHGMAIAGKQRGSVARPAPQRPVPQAQMSRQQATFESGRFEPGLERRWEQAWNRARAGR
jgi:hypothetical protein